MVLVVVVGSVLVLRSMWKAGSEASGGVFDVPHCWQVKTSVVVMRKESKAMVSELVASSGV